MRSKFFPSGAVKSIVEDTSNTTFDYDAFGELHRLTVRTTGQDPRGDQYFGGPLGDTTAFFIKRRSQTCARS